MDRLFFFFFASVFTSHKTYLSAASMFLVVHQLRFVSLQNKYSIFCPYFAALFHLSLQRGEMVGIG